MPSVKNVVTCKKLEAEVVTSYSISLTHKSTPKIEVSPEIELKPALFIVKTFKFIVLCDYFTVISLHSPVQPKTHYLVGRTNLEFTSREFLQHRGNRGYQEYQWPACIREFTQDKSARIRKLGCHYF